ncbi:hypothetical protein [uncultured Ferrimonas sp.]|uniref:hypothetical protein n=1 Tax=uncultured Ferrimonas sp. TaxID=432640 RepID=UPI0026079C55|nr:hypothetical protein [uncultured Ferrimonas sp.]
MEITPITLANSVQASSIKLTLANLQLSHGQMQLGSGSQRFQIPAQAGPFLAAGTGQLVPLQLGAQLPLSALPAPQQQLLSQQLNNNQSLLTLTAQANQPVQLNLAGQAIALAITLPAGQWLLQRVGQQLKLYRAQAPITLTPVSADRPDAPTTNAKAPLTALPSLAQLADIKLLPQLLGQIGRFPFAPAMEGPLGTLTRHWLAQFDPHSSLTELVKGLHQYQQQSQAEPDRAVLFLALPYEQQQQQRQLQLSLKQYAGQEGGSSNNWLLQVRFELELGVLQGNIRWQDEQASLELLCSSVSLTHAADEHLAELRQRLHHSGIPLKELHCRRAEISADLRHQESHYGR